MSQRWSLPGYEVLHLVESGRAGDLWCARATSGSELVTLRRVSRGLDADALRRSAALQADLPYAVRLRDVLDDGQVLVLVLDHAEGGALERVLDRRGSLDPGEVVTIGVPLALALAAADERGLRHGELTASSVWFGGDGRPLLAGLGLSGDDVDAADDVAALATLCLGLLRPSTDPSPDVAALVEALELGRSRDPCSRPDAARLAALLRRAHPPVPVRLQGATGQGRHARPSEAAVQRSARSPGQRVAAALVLLVAAGAAAGWWSGRGGEQPAPLTAASVGAPSPAAVRSGAPAGPDQWRAVLDRLDEVRAEAFAAADPRALDDVYAPGSAALAADSRRVADLRAAGRTATGVRHALGDVEVVTAGADHARLRVVDALPAHEVLAADGTLVGRGAARGERRQLVELTRTADGWRLLSVTPA